MTEKDKVRLSRLTKTFDNNYKITNLYATYLERFPDIITKEMISTLTEDGRISKEEAIVALLSEIFSLDFSRSEDRVLIMNYLTPSVRILDADKYRNNPYYKNIRIESISRGQWELKRETYEPYRAIIASDMEIKEDFTEVPPLGFFTEPFEFPAVLEGGNEWMTLTPVDIDTCDEAIEKAKGKVITFGLGLGYYAYMVSEKPEVKEITVVEKSPEVISLFERHILPQFNNKQKVNIVCSDAFEYAEHIMPNEHFDLAFVDTWRDASDGAPMYRRMKALEKLSPKTEFIYWIEGFLRSRCRAERFEELLSDINSGAEGAPRSYEEIEKIIRNI